MGQSDYILGLLAVGMELALAERDRQGSSGLQRSYCTHSPGYVDAFSRESVTITAFL